MKTGTCSLFGDLILNLSHFGGSVLLLPLHLQPFLKLILGYLVLKFVFFFDTVLQIFFYTKFFSTFAKLTRIVSAFILVYQQTITGKR